MRKKINVQRGLKIRTLRVTRPIMDTKKYQEIPRNTKSNNEIQMSKKIHAQTDSKKSTLRVARPIADTKKYYEIP